MTDELPDGWTYTTVADLVDDLRAGFASGEKNVDGGVSQLRMNNIGLNGELVLDLVRLVPEKLAKGDHFLTPGDVLVCTTNSGKLVGKCAYFDLPGRFTFSNHLTRLRPKRSLAEGRFLRWALWSSWKSGAYEEGTKHWVNQSAIPKEVLSETEVALPPIAEQQRIVEKLEKLLAEVEQCKERMAKIPVLLKRFRQSVLAAACSGRLTADWREVNNKEFDWPMARLADVGEISGGITKNSKRDKMMRQVPYLRVANVYENRILLDEVKIIGVTDQEFSRTRLVKGDVLFVEGNGSIDQIGRVAIWNGSIEGCVHQNHLIKFRSNKSVLPEFVLLSMMASEGRQQLIAKSSSTSGLNTLSISKIEEIELAVAPIDEQREMVRRAMELLGFADRVEERYQAAKKQVDSLTQSILAKAFRGELVPTEAELAAREGRDYESAEALLQRIHSLKIDKPEPKGASRNRLRRRDG